MKRLSDFVKKNKLPLVASFFLPALILTIIYSIFGIFWNGGTTVLAGDAYHQYVNAHALYRDIMHSGKGFFYTFTSGLGLNLYSFSSYYLGSFFMPLTYFFTAENMPNALYLFTILKFGAIGLTAFISFKNMYKTISNWLILPLSTAYSLMSFSSSQSEIIMWLDVFIWLPLIVWGLHALMDAGKKKLYFVSLTILFIQNYYFGFMMAIFLVGYFLARSSFNFTRKKFIKNFTAFSITSLLAGISSLVTILPMYLDLKINGEELTPITKLFTDKSWYFDLFAKNFVGAFDTTKYGSIPMIYVGLVPLVLAVLFFFAKTISLKTKLAYLALLVFINLSFHLEALDLLWQGMHAPNMFLHRYSFTLSLLIVVMALESLTRIGEFSRRAVIDSFIILAVGFTYVLASERYNFLNKYNLILTTLFLAAYFLVAWAFRNNKVNPKLLMLSLLLLMVGETGINSYYQIKGLSNEWGYAKKSHYDEQYDKVDPLAKSLDPEIFTRMENLEPDTANDGMKYDYNSLAQFSSVRNRKSSSTLNLLGFKSLGTNLNLRYPNNTLLGDGIFAIKYNITSNLQASKYGFEDTDFDKLKVNNLALNPAIFVAGGYEDVELINNDVLENQTKMLNKLSGLDLDYFTSQAKEDETISGNISASDSRVTLRKKDSETELSFTYSIMAPARKQLYLKMPNISFSGDKSKDIRITINDKSYSFNPLNTGSFFNLGYYDVATPIDFKLTVLNNDNISFDKTQLWALDVDNYQAAIDKIRANKTEAKVLKNGLSVSYKADLAGDLFLTIPYDQGWSAKIDGKQVAIKEAQTGFMKIKAPAGEHEVILKFVPQGFKLGLTAFIVGVSSFIMYEGSLISYLVNKYKSKKEGR
ncbi:YfhO family protein [Streptococcaceae bacterium ESL0729]|nr:YfhO family protein [Streptococcaceae bacterium ESL0729]